MTPRPFILLVCGHTPKTNPDHILKSCIYLIFVITISNANCVFECVLANWIITESGSLQRTNGTESQNNCGMRQEVKHISARIINGTQALPKHWPWVVAIYDSNDTLVCGGALIAEEYVVTAAHCFGNQDAHKFSARLGTTLRTNSSQCNKILKKCNIQKRTTRKSEVPPKEDEEYHEAPETQVTCVEVESICTPIRQNCRLFMKDIAVVKLKTKVNYTDYIQPICLPENCDDPPASSTPYSVGWGRIFEYYDPYEYEDDNEVEDQTDDLVIQEPINKTLSEVPSVRPQTEQSGFLAFHYANSLMEREIDLIDPDRCSAQLKSKVPGYIICTSGGSCHGDSGGPLMYENNGRWTLVGVASDGPDDCYHPEKPLLFVKVSHFMDSLISTFMQPGNHSDRNVLCAAETARKECVRRFYQFYNYTLE
ncbi:enteropeptidase-like [Ixodes scapularis]|uniref:enteropeptidase-like n=1 Tax=Ixodes scapularis TaxID=6945 RepID=UPI001A9CDA79|nr:enteropeptidase-like [Ixodes scapularis]